MTLTEVGDGRNTGAERAPQALTLSLALPSPNEQGRRFFATDMYRDQVRPTFGGDRYSFDQAMQAKILPERLHGTLVKRATQEATQLFTNNDNSLIIACSLGGKGRVLGTRFTSLLTEQMIQQYAAQGMNFDEATAGVASRIMEVGADGAVNLGNGVLRSIPAYEQFRIEGDTISEQEKQAVRDYVTEGDDPYIGDMRAYFTQRLQHAQEIAEDRPITWLLIDDQQGTGLTHTIAHKLIEYAADKANKTVQVHDVTDLVKDWDHVPGHFVRQSLARSVTPRMILSQVVPPMDLSGFTDANLSRQEIRNIADQLGINAHAFNTFFSTLTSQTEGYVLRGGYATQDAKGNTLVVQQPYLGHIVRCTGNFGHGDIEVAINTSDAVGVYNAEVDALLLGK